MRGWALYTQGVITSLASNPCDAGSTPFPGQDKQKCLQTLPDSGERVREA